jgi:hypothetical protein
MNKPDFHINSFDDLVAEKLRLKAHFHEKKLLLRQEVAGLKDTFNPLSVIIKSVGKFTSPDKSMGLLNTGLSFTLDLLLRKFILKKSNWMVKLAAPFFIRNLLSHLAAYKIKTNMPEMEPVISKLTKTAKN